jgi:hypothetical protein
MKQAKPGLLARAIEIAASAHVNQVDKGGAPYILHPLRMMMKQTTEPAMIAAVLHDVVEDTPWTLQKLRAEGFSEDVLEAVACLTKRKGEDYADFIARAGVNPIARLVKLADLEDNMDLKRIPEPVQKDFDRLAKYRRSWETLKRMEADPLTETLDALLPLEEGGGGGGEESGRSAAEGNVPAAVGAVCAALRAQPGVDALRLGRQVEEKRAVSQDLELWMSREVVADG